uniref:Transmembrane protein n=1 Tax=Trypanosoma vivax (strain Y486) TaxID=1055687 RepID=G0U800_TRYVY|nr:conserved hypothetical protein [Trypanosoma vivax Y486]
MADEGAKPVPWYYVGAILVLFVYTFTMAAAAAAMCLWVSSLMLFITSAVVAALLPVGVMALGLGKNLTEGRKTKPAPSAGVNDAATARKGAHLTQESATAEAVRPIDVEKELDCGQYPTIGHNPLRTEGDEDHSFTDSSWHSICRDSQSEMGSGVVFENPNNPGPSSELGAVVPIQSVSGDCTSTDGRDTVPPVIASTSDGPSCEHLRAVDDKILPPPDHSVSAKERSQSTEVVMEEKQSPEAEHQTISPSAADSGDSDLDWGLILEVLLKVLAAMLAVSSFLLAFETRLLMAVLPVFVGPLMYTHTVCMSKANRKGRTTLFNIRRSLTQKATTHILIITASFTFYFVALVLALVKGLRAPFTSLCAKEPFVYVKFLSFASPPLVIFVGCTTPLFVEVILSDSSARRRSSAPSMDVRGRRWLKGLLGEPCGSGDNSHINRDLITQPQNQVHEGNGVQASKRREPHDSRLSPTGLSNIHATPVGNLTDANSNPLQRALLPNPGCDHCSWLKNLTLLYVAFRNINSASPSSHHERVPRGDPANVTRYFDALVKAAAIIEPSHGSFCLTVYRDALCFVWGTKPCSIDPILCAVKKAVHIFSAFETPECSHPDFSLVAGILHLPRALASLLSVGDTNTIHFFGGEHRAGEQLLTRGLMLRQLERKTRDRKEFSTSGILMDDCASHRVVNEILSRPVGVLPQLGNVITGTDSRSNISTLKRHIAVYDYVSLVSESQMESHLALQRREKLSAAFLPLSKAIHTFHQGDLTGATKVLESALKKDGDVLFDLVLSDLRKASQYDAH